MEGYYSVHIVPSYAQHPQRTFLSGNKTTSLVHVRTMFTSIIQILVMVA